MFEGATVERPLVALIVDPNASFQLQFAQQAALAVTIPEVETVVSGAGLSVRCLWHGDLATALGEVRHTNQHAVVDELYVDPGPQADSEPMVELVISCQSDLLGDLVGELNSRRARITAMAEEGGAQIVTCVSPIVGLDRLPAWLEEAKAKVLRASFAGCQVSPESPRPPHARALAIVGG